MPDQFQKRNVMRYALPRMDQLSSRAGSLALLLGALAVAFGAPPEVADVVGQTTVDWAGGIAALYGVHAVFTDDGTSPPKGTS